MDVNAESVREVEEGSMVKKILLAGGKTANAMKVSYVLGVGLGAIGRSCGIKGLVVVPPAMDLIHGTSLTPERAVCYMAYGAGIATAYADKVYSAISDFIEVI